MNLEEKQDEAYKKAIIVYLNNRVKTDEYLLAACEKENKTLNGVIAYIKSEARKQAKDGVACIPDDTVYDWAVHYILEDGIDFEKKSAKEAEDKQEEIEAPAIERKEYKKQKKPAETICSQLDLF
jgi:hypothetical protein